MASTSILKGGHGAAVGQGGGQQDELFREHLLYFFEFLKLSVKGNYQDADAAFDFSIGGVTSVK